MTNPTSNFGWQMPTSTDLVTDLPADFAVFGQAVDTSMADLKGGTTGQILSKATSTDMDFTWITNDVGDITAVTAGTGISGGGTSGAVTITNDMATTITAAGDIVIGTGSGTYDNLPIGTTAQVLTADTTVSPYKVKWATPAGGSTFSGATVYRNAASGTSIPTSTSVTATWQVEEFDVDGYWDAGAPTRFTIPTGKSGKFIITGRLTYTANATGYRGAGIGKNGGTVNYAGPTVQAVTSSGIGTGVTNAVIVSAVAGDYFEIFYGQNSGSTLTSEPGGGIYYDLFSIAYLGA
jgi:hypothetical protein